MSDQTINLDHIGFGVITNAESDESLELNVQVISRLSDIDLTTSVENVNNGKTVPIHYGRVTSLIWVIAPIKPASVYYCNGVKMTIWGGDS